MKFIVAVTATLLAVVQCKPQYNYPAPSGSYGTPGTSGISGGGLVSGGGGGFISGGTGGGLISGGNVGGFSGGSGGGFSGGSGGGFSGGSGGGFSGGSGGGFSGGSGGGFTGASGGFVSGGGGGVLVQKHIYVHVAPPEPEEFRPQKQINVGQATKHYKIIFIKAPSYSAQSAQSIALQQQNQEKTLVYVLVKRPEDAADIAVPTITPTQPSKPEVYFIRYKAKSEAVGGGAIGGGAIGGGAIGGGAIGGGAIGGGAIGGGAIGGGSIGGGNIGISTGSSSSSIITGRPAAQYGPPGQSGPY